MTADPAGLVESLLTAAGLDPRRPMLGPIEVRPVAVGWATVDLERAAKELAAPQGRTVRPAEADTLLGAAVELVVPGDRTPPPGPALVLLEPTTEGRLAGALARRGEGAAVLYLAPIDVDSRSGPERLAAAGIRTRLGRGPFGDAALILGRRAAEPLLVLVAVPSEP